MTKTVTPVHSGITLNTTTSDLGKTKASSFAASAQRVALKDILRDDALQVRAKVDHRVVLKYAEKMRAGAEFPPIKLARINGSLYLVDGWHRFGAACENDQWYLWADISDMTLDEARWQAAKANTQHGLPLKTREYRDVFRAFIDSDQHTQGKKLMPYREIATQIGKPFSTIRNWMEADYPRLFKKYQQNANGVPGEAVDDREEKQMRRRLGDAEAALYNVKNIGRTLDPRCLGELISTARGVLSDLENKPYQPVMAADF
jgi:hypothetical protein